MADYYQNYAQIKEGIVQDIRVFRNYTEANKLTKIMMGTEAIAVYCNEYKVSIGCTYVDGIFYDEDGNPCEQNFTVHTCKDEMEKIQAQYRADMSYIAMEANVSLEQE